MSEIKLDKIADIIPPTPPLSAIENIWMIFFILAFFIFLITITYYRSEKQQFKRLKKQYLNKKINQRQLAFKLSSLLKKAAISHVKHSSSSFQSQLLKACFSRNSIDNKEISQLIHEAEKWI